MATEIDEQQQTDDFVQTWVRVPVSPGPRADSAPGPGSLARPDGLSFATMLVRSVREDKREADWVASTGAVDSYDTIIEQDWDGPHGGLDRYRANPVILFAHNSCALPIGRATKIGVENEGKPSAALLTTVRFATAKANPMAEFCWQSVLEGMLLGMSVGWRAGAWERREINGEMRDVAIRNVLYENSICPVPSNPEALMRVAQRAFGARVFSFPPPSERANPAGQAGKPQTQAAPTAKNKDKRMKTVVIDNAAADGIRRLGVAEVKVDGEETVRVVMPNLSEVDMKTRAAEERAVAAERKVETLTRDLENEKKRAAEAETAQRTAETARTEAEKKRDAAIAERATVELEPLTGLDPWQMSPATRDHIAKLAATDPASYQRLRDEHRDKGERVGALKREESREGLPSRQPDPTPRNHPHARSDGGLIALAEKNLAARDAQTVTDDAAN